LIGDEVETTASEQSLLNARKIILPVLRRDGLRIGPFDDETVRVDDVALIHVNRIREMVIDVDGPGADRDC
jgi:hypothetical protein